MAAGVVSGALRGLAAASADSAFVTHVGAASAGSAARHKRRHMATSARPQPVQSSVGVPQTREKLGRPGSVDLASCKTLANSSTDANSYQRGLCDPRALSLIVLNTETPAASLAL